MATVPSIKYNESFNTGTLSGGPRINIDYRTQLIRQRESAAPFLSLMLNINSEGTKTNTFKTFETRPNPKKGTVNGAVSQGSVGAAVTINVTTGHGVRFNVGDLVRPQNVTASSSSYTVEGIITAITTDALTVYPNDKTLAMEAIPDAATLQVWGNSFAQGTTSANPAGTVPTLKTYYTQIFKNSYQVNKTHANNRLYGSPERDRLRGEKEIEHMIEIEKALLNGTGVLDTSGTEPRTTLTGLINQISSNVLTYGSTMSPKNLFDFMTTVHAPKYATDGKMSKRMVLASADLLAQVNEIARVQNQNVGVTTVYGVDVSKLVWAGRTWEFIEDPILSDFLPGCGIVFHPRYVKLREFRPTMLQANIQANDADYFKDEFLTEIGLEVQLEELHGYIKP